MEEDRGRERENEKNAGYEHDKLQAHFARPLMTYLKLEHSSLATLMHFNSCWECCNSDGERCFSAKDK